MSIISEKPSIFVIHININIWYYIMKRKDEHMFNVYDVQTRETTSNMTADEVAEYLTGKGALSEKETHEYDAGLVFENKEWLDKYSVKYIGSEDIEQAYNKIRTALK